MHSSPQPTTSHSLPESPEQFLCPLLAHTIMPEVSFNKAAGILLKYKSECSSLLLKTIQWLPCYSEQETEFYSAEKVGSLLLHENPLPDLYPFTHFIGVTLMFCCSLLLKFFFHISPWFIPLSPLIFPQS